MRANLDYLHNKIIDRAHILQRIREWRLKSARIAFTNGCFDLLHTGHLQTLIYCADRADKVVVGLNSDASVQRLKGPERPFIVQEERALLLAALQFVDAVVLFEEDTPLDLITAIRPELLVKGGDWSPNQIVGATEVKDAGGEVHIVPFVPSRSTTLLADKLRKA